MTYTALAITGVVVALAVDIAGLRTRLVGRRVFWAAYAIIVSFQLLSNGILTGTSTVHYADEAIIGAASPEGSRPPFIGDGRVAYAPMEDLAFGFAMVLLTQSLWIYWGRRGVQRTPVAGPPMWQSRR